MKNLITSALLLLALLLPATAAAYDFEADGIYYNINGNEVSVTYKTNSYNSYSGDVTIPEAVTYNGTTYTVTAIGMSAFQECSELATVTIPNSVTMICDLAFQLSSLTSLNLPNSIISIGWSAFSSCSNLTSVTIPNSVTSIAEGAFSSCTNLTSVAVASENPNYDSRDNCNAIIETASNTLIAGCQNTIIPNSVISIGDFAFFQCTGLMSVDIPNSVTTIGDWAFEVCTGLTSIFIPNSVTTIGELAFGLCNGLTSIIVDSSNPKYDSRNDCNAIIETSSNTLITGCQNTAIPNSIITIGDWAFYCCFGMESITIPNSVTKIGKRAFADCNSLTSVTIPKFITYIANEAFADCSSLEDVYCHIVDPSTISMGTNVFVINSPGYYPDYSGRTLHVPHGTWDSYNTNTMWSNYFETIVEMDYVRGDVNGDGEVNIADINALIDIIMGDEADDITLIRADVNSDGEINIADINAIIRIIMGGDEPISDNHEYIDLGLSSGTQWATMNVGANSPEEYGDYFAWGETTPKDAYSWGTYKWCEGSWDTLTKYCTDSIYGTVDNKTELEPTNDAAYVKWGPWWRMPTLEQMKELMTECDWKWETVNGVNGFVVTGPNGNTIFLPAAGYRYSDSLYGDGSYGSYWSRMLYPDRPRSAYDLDFGEDSVYWSYYYRYYGFSVRAVRVSPD